MRVCAGRKWIIGVVALAFLAGCDELPRVNMPDWDLFDRTADAPDKAPVESVEEMPEAEAEDVSPKLSGALGTTIVSLGAASEPGMWLKTPLVDHRQKGRVYHNGLWLAVTLIPIDGPATAGSRMSLSAMRALELPLTELTEVRVSAG